jgi:hypothetical protein
MNVKKLFLTFNISYLESSTLRLYLERLIRFYAPTHIVYFLFNSPISGSFYCAQYEDD